MHYLILIVKQDEHHYRPQTKLRKGNVFTSVCQEFCPQGKVYTSRADNPLGDSPGRHTP